MPDIAAQHLLDFAFIIESVYLKTGPISMNKVEFFFDCSSPWTYLAFESYQSVQRRHADLKTIYRPILVGGIFNTVNPSVYENRGNPVPVKQKYYLKDLQDWADFVDVKIGQPAVFPVNSVKAMRGALFALEQNLLVEYARAIFHRYWTLLDDISQVDILKDIVNGLGIDELDFFTAIQDQQYKDLLRSNTEELVTRGGFGTPTFFLNDTDMFFGNDRLVLLESRL